MKAENRARHRELVHREINNTRDELHNLGFTVDDVSLRTHPTHLDYAFYEPDDLFEEQSDVRYDVRYTVTMSQRMATDILSLVEALERNEARISDLEIDLRHFKQQYLNLKMPLCELYDVIDSNPGIREQWDEIMTMLKMAGFNGHLPKG